MGNKISAEFKTEIDNYIKDGLLQLTKATRPQPMTLEEFKKRSDEFASTLTLPFHIPPLPLEDREHKDDIGVDKNTECVFPTETARLKFLKDSPDILEDLINTTRPIIHERLVRLIIIFLQFKKQYGTKKERKLYNDMSVLQLIDRIIKKRPLMFCNAEDKYKLPNCEINAGGFDKIGKDNELKHLSIKDYMTYDEMRIGALLSISSKSIFVNDGERNNHGVPGKPGTFESKGVILGQVGPRFQRISLMDYIDCVITEEQNVNINGYGIIIGPKYYIMQEWANLWNVSHFPTWADVQKSFEGQEAGIDAKRMKDNSQYKQLGNKYFFNKEIYKERIKIGIRVYIAEAQQRANDLDKEVYLHVVGLGLGVWRISECQEQLYVDSWGEVLKENKWDRIRHVDFSWIPVFKCLGIKDGEKIPNTDITIHFSYRNMHDTVPDGLLLVCHYAWDGNSLPGNEYWVGSLTSSSDPAAAGSSCIAELQNHYINRLVCADNLHVATDHGIMHVKEYAEAALK